LKRPLEKRGVSLGRGGGLRPAVEWKRNSRWRQEGCCAHLVVVLARGTCVKHNFSSPGGKCKSPTPGIQFVGGAKHILCQRRSPPDGNKATGSMRQRLKDMRKQRGEAASGDLSGEIHAPSREQGGGSYARATDIGGSPPKGEPRAAVRAGPTEETTPS